MTYGFCVAAAGGGAGGVGGGGAGGGVAGPLSFVSPQAGARIDQPNVELVVQASPMTADAGAVSYRVALADGGGVQSGALSPRAGNTFGTTVTLSEGAWTATAVSGLGDASVQFVVDLTGPTFVVEPPSGPPEYGANSAGFMPTDPDGPAYRRDETIAVRVRSSDVDVASVALSARFGTAEPLVLTTSTPCDAGCWEFAVDLSRVAMPGFSGPVALSATGMDTLGHAQAVDAGASVRVTRWQWARKVGGPVRATPAIGNGGRLFLGTAAAVTGVAAVDADGGVAWPAVSDGPVTGPLSVARSDNSEYVFFQVATAPGTIKTISAGSGAIGAQTCAGLSGTSTNEAGVAVMAEGSQDVASICVQSATGVENRANVLSPRTNTCAPASGGVSRTLAPGNLVLSGTTAFMAGSNGNLRAFDFDGGATALREIDAPVGAAVGVVNGLAMISSTQIAGGGGGGPGIGRLFSFAIDGGEALNAWPSASQASAPVSGPVVSSAALFAVARDQQDRARLVKVSVASGNELARTSSLQFGSTQGTFSGSSSSSPVVGTNGRIYVVDESGSTFVVGAAFTADAGAEWGNAMSSMVGPTVVSASPTLDCNRRKPSSQTGVLYIATESGWLVSYLVDSPGGLDPTAPWPKYARDARNTGNFNGPPIGCP